MEAIELLKIKKQMEKFSEIIFQDNKIDKIPDHLNLQVGEKFYFSLRNPTPRAEQEFKDNNKAFEDHFVNGVIDNIKNACNKFWIMEFIVTDVSKSYEKSYHTSIENPRVQWIETITVEECPSPIDLSLHQMD